MRLSMVLLIVVDWVNHHANELIVVEKAIVVLVTRLDYLSDLAFGQILANLLHDHLQLLLADQPVAVPIEDLEGLD